MTDDAYERLAQRNAELEQEKAALAEELEHTQGDRFERTGLPANYHALNDEGYRLLGSREDVAHFRQQYDAMVAHVERLRWALSQARFDSINQSLDEFNAMKRVLDEAPTTSLARLKAQWQGEVLESVATEPVFRGLPRHHLRERAGRIRRQAEAGTPKECRDESLERYRPLEAWEMKRFGEILGPDFHPGGYSRGEDGELLFRHFHTSGNNDGYSAHEVMLRLVIGQLMDTLDQHYRQAEEADKAGEEE